jgi:hypothetical protein
MRPWWPESVSAVTPLLRKEDDEELGPANRLKGCAIGLAAEEIKGKCSRATKRS